MAESLIFEPHNGFGRVDPYGEPWPFGYLSEGPGAPVFELSVPLPPHPVEKLLDIALKAAAAPELYEALAALVEEHVKRGGAFDEPLGSSEQTPEINAGMAALAKARPAC
ncbi:MAG: hypothetical protein QOH47_2383 [Sphingomonadales bacterium]|jgi:hypothetical protein|nr:hypothetical protein [Sphingomonadales bacterium]